jgi:hypothetical protein
LFSANVIEQHRKLIAGDAAKDVALSHAGLHTLRDLQQQLITARATKAVVYELETINVEQKNSEVLILIGLLAIHAHLQ